MKRMMIILALAMVFAAIADNSADYFPVGIGYTWTYQDSSVDGVVMSYHEIVGTEMIEGHETWITEETDPEGVDSSYTQIRTDGIYMIISFLDTLGSDRRPIKVAPAEINVGTSWTAADIDTSFNMGGADISIQVEISMEALAREDITVPGGSFESCLKIAMESIFTYEVSFGGMPFAAGSGVQSRDTTWFAQFVGAVQSRGMEYEIDMMSGEIADSNKTASYLQEYDFTNVAETSPKPSDLTISAYPNPFNSAVALDVPVGAEVSIFDINGRRVADLGSIDNGIVRWEPAVSVESGVYFARVTAGESAVTQRLLFIK
ncbi:MAG TPA: T9SS type A sorting domain-containing protein [candidate division Zixibacteria bacterium]|nr:T9SS type A sorting domain-containing protein [candidate division Zixibacteria bacterium]